MLKRRKRWCSTRERGRVKRMSGNGKGRKIEQVNEFKYLGHTFNERATDKAHIREIVRKANKVMGNRREKVGR
jgi:hypothetical protein